MKKGHLILGILLLFALFVFIPNGAADDEGLLADYFKFKEEAETYSQGEISPDRSPSFGAAGDVGDLAAYCDEQCYDEGCYAACGMEPDAAECTTVRDDPNTPEDEFYVSPGCYARIAYQECLSKCDAAREDCWIKCMSTGETPGKCGNGICDAGENCATCPNDCPCGQGKICNPGDSNADARGCAMPRMDLTVSTGKKTYSPEETVIIEGSVKDAKGNAIPDVSFVIEVEGIDISTLSGTMYDVTCCGGQFNLPKDVSEGTYTVTVTASKTGYPDVSGTTSFTVGQLKIEVEGNYTGVTADGISELHFIVEFPKEATNHQFNCESDEMGAVFEKIILQSPCELVSDQTEKMEIKFKPRREEITEPYKVRVDVTVDMPDGQQLSAYKEVQVVRPPVVFIHGIWSNSSSMNPMRRSIINSNLYNEYPAGHTLGVDYGAQSNQDLRKSAKFLADGVDKILQKLEKEGIKVSRVDIVAHSMGGLISRYYMLFGYMDSNGQVIGPGQAAKVRKLITLDTPHAGSHVADWYVDFMDNDYVVCKDDPKKFDKNKVTDNELRWFLNTIRSKVGMQSDGLEFGEAVRQMQTPGRNGSIIDKLRSQNAANVKYYLIAGDVPLLNSWEKWFVVPIVMHGYPYHKEWYYLPDSRHKIYYGGGPCNESNRKVVGDMVREFRDIIGEEDTDGVVPIKSQIDSTMLAKKIWTFHSTHLGITTNPFAHYRVMEYLTDGRMAIKLHTIVISESPGHLHVYDKEGRHVGIDPNGQPDIGINGADYVPFSDMMGEHEYIWVPETDGIRVEFLADEEGTVGLDISQSLDDGLHWFSYENIGVTSGSKVSVQLHPTTPTGQIVHSDGATENIVPAYSEIPKGGGKNNLPTASFSIMPESPKTSDTIVVASTSFDPDDDTLTYSWYRDGSEIGNSPNWEWENPQAGEHTLKLVVEDGKGGRDEDSKKINVGVISTDIPGFEIALLIGAIVVALIIIKRRKHNL